MTAGIGILAQASPMMQDMFERTPLEAAAVVSLISLFNAGGRFLWASGSDYIGRRNTYTIFFAVQVGLFLLIPGLAAGGSWWLFQASLFVVFTMYGGGFATIPAFLADIFGPQNVGAIHGALLTAWSVAAIAGPVIITELSNRAKAALPPGADRVNIYDLPLQVLAGLLAVGFVLTLLVRPLKTARLDAAKVRPKPRPSTVRFGLAPPAIVIDFQAPGVPLLVETRPDPRQTKHFPNRSSTTWQRTSFLASRWSATATRSPTST